MDICTIIAKNYVAQARVLARSFLDHNPDGRCFVLVIDDYRGYIEPTKEPFVLMTPQEIGCREFQEMALRYDVLELSTAVKPWLLAQLLQESPTITYLDPDIRVFSSLEQLDALALEHGLVVTPHNTTPLPDDGKRPNQVDILLAGVYNLGYVSLRADGQTSALLGWWRERLITDCRVDPLNGYFVDQRWFDLAPGLVSDHAILRDSQYNLAYWNLHSRELRCEDERYLVDDEPLAFFHFSGFDPAAPDVLSRHQSRISVSRGSPLERLCAQYADEVRAAGYTEASQWPYAYHLLPSGLAFNRRLRKLHAVAVEAGRVHESPFTAAGEASFLRWLAEPAAAAPPGINRVLADVYGTRSDLQETFPEVGGAHHEAFLRWAQASGVMEEPVLGVLPITMPVVPSEERSEAPASAGDAGQAPVFETETRVPWGVNVVGYFRSELGTGEAARQVVSALDARGVPLLPVHGRTIPPNRQGHAFTHLQPSDARYPVNLLCINADMLGEFAAQAGPSFFDARYSIGLWFWEVERFPQRWSGAFAHIDELWLATDHIIQALSPVATVPIAKVTLPVELPPVFPASRQELSLPEGFMFLYSFDHHSVFERKNPIAIVEAYMRAFAPDDGTVLVVKSINGESAPEQQARLRAAARGRDDVHIIDGYFAPELKNMMVDACDCYVSLHRAEGFGLTMAEAMYLQKPVIATGYSGNLDFMTEQNSFLVDYELVDIGRHAEPYPHEGRWADPSVAHAASLMREVFEDRVLAGERARRGAEDIRRTHSPDAAGAVMGERLDRIRAESPAGASFIPLRDSRAAAALQSRLAAGPPLAASSKLGPPGKLARRLLLRVLRPFTAYQHVVDIELARSLQEISGETHQLDVATAERVAGMLARLRRDDTRTRMEEYLVSLIRASRAFEHSIGELQGEAPRIDELAHRLDELARSVQELEWQGRAIPYMEGEPFPEIDLQPLGVVQGYTPDGRADGGDLYRAFEDTFRGSEELIRDRQRRYLELVSNYAPVVDIGCGRGEFLDLLAERDVPHVGVDSDPGMVQRCREKGHLDVVEGDGVAYLKSLPDESVGTVFCAQVIEHMPYESLLELLRVARAKLREDGLFVAETVNPHSAPALKTFWVDLTHQHPIFPEVALSLCRSSGFRSAFVFHPNGSGNVDRDRYQQGEYAVVAGGATLMSAAALRKALAAGPQAVPERARLRSAYRAKGAGRG